MTMKQIGVKMFKKTIMTIMLYVLLISTSCAAESTAESPKTISSSSQILNSAIIEKYFTPEFYEKLEKRYDEMELEICGGESIPTYRNYIAFADITDDGIPEIFYGYDGVNNKTHSYFRIYSITEDTAIFDQNNEYIRTIETAILSDTSTILTGKYYINEDGTRYYESVLCDYEGTQLMNFICRFWYDGSQWQTKYIDLDQDEYENPDVSFPLATAIQEIDYVNLGFAQSVYECYKIYENRVNN